MWCLNGNTDIEAHEGDFRTAKDVAKRLQEADVVVCRFLASKIKVDNTVGQQRGLPLFSEYRTYIYVPRYEGWSQDSQLETLRTGGRTDERV